MKENELLSNRSESSVNLSENTLIPSASSRALEELFETQIRGIPAVRAEKAHELGFARRSEMRNIGETWFINPRYGTGSYWYYILEEGAAIASMKMTLFNDVFIPSTTMNFICFGLYAKNMFAYYTSAKAMRNEGLLGYSLRFRPPGIRIKAFDPLASTSLTFTPKAVSIYARELGCCPLDINRAVSLLKGRRNIIGLPAALRTIAAARPGSKYAERYYRSKVTEALVLLLDGLERNDHSNTPSEVDEHAVHIGRSYIEENLAADLSTKKLADVLHVSEGKLINAFKTIEGTTPQAYVRKRRVSYAQALLIDSVDTSIREIAHRTGYKNQGSFTDAFKQEAGCTPSEYRTQHAGRTKALER